MSREMDRQPAGSLARDLEDAIGRLGASDSEVEDAIRTLRRASAILKDKALMEQVRNFKRRDEDNPE